MDGNLEALVTARRWVDEAGDGAAIGRQRSADGVTKAKGGVGLGEDLVVAGMWVADLDSRVRRFNLLSLIPWITGGERCEEIWAESE
ncbi:hypothetical protein TIFTF001_043963 [Ficus carica]|uniref:Uncharacterized protein n=1 Tax=Ficus carica TaxID=3494 RepID=A0AA88CR15_FICCA|nr:hypothetical protein TIFTF001_043963 [Ficus carica]